MKGALTECTPLDPDLIFLKAPCTLPHYGPEVVETPESGLHADSTDNSSFKCILI
jgi:hypothetical protein